MKIHLRMQAAQKKPDVSVAPAAEHCYQRCRLWCVPQFNVLFFYLTGLSFNV